MSEQVILVNENDEAIGTMEKMEAHQKGLLHRAFSIFIFNSKNQLLLQQRAASKYHCPLLWTNTCCSHPRINESLLDAANRRLQEEMGMSAELNHAFHFTYKAGFSNGLIEHEFDHVFIGTTDVLPEINTNEVASYSYVSLAFVTNDMLENPNNYTPWFKLALNQVISHL